MSSANGRLVVFLDRDGVINRRRQDHVKSWDEFEFLPGALAALAKLRGLDARVAVITNQSVVGRGLLSEDELRSIHQRMRDEVIHCGGMIERVYACTHTPERGCACRKPATELFHRAGAELEISLGGSFMVGDSEADVQAARAVRSRPILITDNGPRPDRGGIPLARNLMEAVHLIAEIHSKHGAQSCS